MCIAGYSIKFSFNCFSFMACLITYFGVNPLLSFMFSVLHLIQPFSPKGLTIVVSLFVIFSLFATPGRALISSFVIFRAQSSLFPSSISTLSSVFFPASFRPCSHCYSGTVIRHKFVPAQLSRNIGARSH